MMLSDGTIIPSYLGVTQRGSSHGASDMLNNYVLRYGEVREINYPDDKVNYTGKQVEYTVAVQHRSGNGLTVTNLYRGVTVNNLFGGTADRIEMTYRPSDKVPPNGIGNGSKVLLLCISGDQQKAVILGGVSSPTEKAKDQGHNLFFEFNGVQFTVNDDGEAVLTHKGKTKADGTNADGHDVPGSKVSFDKDGNITVSTPDNAQFITISHKDGKVEIQGDALDFHTGGTTDISGDEKVTVNCNNDKIVLTAGQGVHVGAATDSWIKGTTYRAAEGTMNQSIGTAVSSAASLAGTMAATLATAGVANAVPMMGGVMAAPAFAALAVQIGMLASMLGSISAALNGFEAGAQSYLSTKNRGD